MRSGKNAKKKQRTVQQNFFDDLGIKRNSLCHGGELTVGKRKTRRPLDRRKPIHLVLRSSRATGQLSFLHAKNKIVVEKIIKKQAAKFGVKIAKAANVGNHIHLLLRFSHRKSFQSFLISVSGMIARFVTKARKGIKFGRFWDTLAFTRVITSSFVYLTIYEYVVANQIEGRCGRTARKNYLKLLSG